MSKIILHIDLNTFFVRCEEILNPSLIGKPVIIGHQGRGGIVSTCSYEARKYGVSSGMPVFKALELCKDAILIEHGFEFYHQKSREFFEFISRYSPLVEKASVDECYVDMTSQLSNVKDVKKYLLDMQQKLFEETQLKCSIGVAPTKFLAKMASDMKKPMGLVIIRRKDARKMLSPLPIKDFYGIGKKTAPRLEQNGIKTIGDLINLIDNDEDRAKAILGSFYFVIKDWINGYGDDKINTEPFDPKSIGCSTTFLHDTNDMDEIKDYLKTVSKEVSTRAKEANKVGYGIQIVIKDTNFKSINRSKRLNSPTNELSTIYNEASTLLEKNLQGRVARLVGLTLQNLIDPLDESEQISIFDDFNESEDEKETKMIISMINKKMNKKVLVTASESLREKKNANK